MQFSETALLSMVASFLWPLLRIGGMFVTFPVFSSQSVPVQIRVILSLAITVLVTPLLPTVPQLPLLSFETLMAAAQQVFIGILGGFILQLVFSAVVFGGQSIAFSMGLGFASMVDPQTGVQVPIISQLYLMLTTLVFLGMDGHLLFIEMLVHSFQSLPVSVKGIDATGIWQLIGWGGHIFAGGLLLSLPVLSSLLLVNLSFGVATRAAPQLNIFSIGFTVTILVGMVLIWITLPSVMSWFSSFVVEAYHFIEVLFRI